MLHSRDPLAGAPASAWLTAYDASLTAPLRRELRGWSLLAVGSLAVAGVLALLLVMSRTPKLQDLLPWPWESFFYTALVTHVVFSFVVWYVAFLGAAAVLATARSAAGRPRLAALGPAGLWLGVAGAALLIGVTLADQGEASLNNYVPVLSHPLYYAGLAILGVGVALPVVRLLANPGRIGDTVEFGVAACGVAYLVALLCFVIAWMLLPAGTDIAAFNERLFWGGGHVLQFVNTGLMMMAWQSLAVMAFGEAPVDRRLYWLLMAGLVVFVLPGPIFYFTFDVLGLAHRYAFTDLLWYGLSLPPAVMILGVFVLLWRWRGTWPWRSPAFLGLILSILVFAVGGVFGFFLGVSDTRTPSHYHAVIGGVNLAFMGLMVALMLPVLGRAVKTGRWVWAQFYLYGFGQLLWSVGMFLAGAAGVPRKTAGVEQGLDSVGKLVSMAMTGTGGLIAVLGGILFIWFALRRLLAREAIDG